MKKYFILIFLILLLSSAFSCSIVSITTDSKYLVADSNSKITITTTSDCENYNINVFARDLMTLEDKEIYDGEITNQTIKLNYKNNPTPTITKIYASTYQKIGKKSIAQEELKSTPIILLFQVGNVVGRFTNNLSGVFYPSTYEYEDEIILEIFGYHYSNVLSFNSDFGFYFLNTDFNVISVTGDPELGEISCESKAEGFPYSCKFNYTFYNFERRYATIKIKGLKYNDRIYTFGTDGPGDLHDMNKMIYAKPFITINNIEKNIDQNYLTIDYNMYNSFDINYCALIIDGNETQRDYNINENNQFIQNLSQGEYTADINCYTPFGHISYPATYYLTGDYNQDVYGPKPQPSADNYPIYLDQSLEISFYPFENGNGTENNPFELNECSELNLISEFSESNFVLKNDLNCNGETIYPINNFNGILDGNGFTIYDLTINSPLEDNVGLFSVLNGTAKRVGLENANIAGKNNVGAIAGVNNGTIEEVKVSGTVSGQEKVGGIVGLNNGEFNADPYNGITYSTAPLAKILNSYSQANIVANNSSLIAGENKGHIENVFSTGNLIGNNSAALAVINYTKCYSYQHYFDSAVIKNSIALSSLETTITNSCYSHWYYGSVVTKTGLVTNSITTTDSNYFLDINNNPFNNWDFNSVWNFDENNITLAWEQ